MRTQTNDPERGLRDEELADVLTAISVISKRLARKLAKLARQEEQKVEGGSKDDE